jgi:hypothetical protein
MVGITLSAEQIHQAPPEVRRWLEQQIAVTFGPYPGGLYPGTPMLETPARHLIECSVEDARAVLSVIQGILPAVGIFFELAREPFDMAGQGIRSLRLDEMGRHAHLQSTDQVVACLRLIDRTSRRALGNPDAALAALDGAGHCLVADVTARSILALWREIVVARDLAPPNGAPVRVAPVGTAPPYTAAVRPVAAADPAVGAASQLAAAEV